MRTADHPFTRDTSVEKSCETVLQRRTLRNACVTWRTLESCDLENERSRESCSETESCKPEPSRPLPSSQPYNLCAATTSTCAATL